MATPPAGGYFLLVGDFLKIRYILKHFVFRLSRAFYHARKFLAAFGLCLMLLCSLFAFSSAAEVPTIPKNHIWADNVGLFYSQADMNMVGKPNEYLLLDNATTGTYKMWFRFSTNDSFSEYRYANITSSNTLRSDILMLGTVFNRGSQSIRNWSGVELGIQGQYGNDVGLDQVFNLHHIIYGQRVSFAMDIKATSGFEKFNKCYAVLRCKDLASEYELYYIIGWYDLSQYASQTSLSLYFDFENNSGYTLQPVGIYFYQVPKTGVQLSGDFGIGNIKYHVFTEDEKKLAQYNDIVNNQTEQIVGSIQGWNGEGTPPAGGNVVGELGSAEDELMQNQSEGLNKSNEIFSSISTQIKQFGPAFMGVSAFLENLFGVSFFSFLITLSLAIGIISLLLNLVPSIKSSIESNKRREAFKASQEKRSHARK